MINKGELLRSMLEESRYELHIVPGSPIMFRNPIGELEPINGETISTNDTKSFIGELLNAEQKSEFAQNKEIDFIISASGVSRYRFSVAMQRGSISAIVRTYPKEIADFEKLNLHKSVKDIADNISKGIVLVTGPKGSGKSTTLAAVINHMIAARPIKILSLENPIKYLFANKKGVIAQREMGVDLKDRGLFFQNLINQSADVLIIDELTNPDEALKLMLLAAGGTIVFLKMISPSITHAIELILNLFPSGLQDSMRAMVATSLEAGISQVLCKDVTGKKLLPAMEIYRATNNLRQNIRENKFDLVYQVMGGAGKQLGMANQESSLRLMEKQNLITKDEAMARTCRPDAMTKLFAQPF